MTAGRKLTSALAARGAVAQLTAAAAIGQLALVVAIPFLARVYEAGDIGRFAAVSGAAQLMTVLVTGRLEQVLPRLSRPHRAIVLRFLWLLSILSVFPASLIGYAMYQGEGAVALGILVFATCALNISSFVMISGEAFLSAATARASNGILTAVLQVLAGLLWPTLLSLSVAYAIGSLMTVLFARRTAADYRRAIDSSSTLTDVFGREKLGRFALSVGTSGMLSNASVTLPTILIAFIYGSGEAAAFFFARRLLAVPTQLLSRAISEASYGSLSGSSPSRVASEFQRTVGSFVKPGLALAVVGLIASLVLPAIVGSGYENIGLVCALLVPSAVMQLCATSFSNFALLLHKEWVNLVWNACRLGGICLIFVGFQLAPSFVRDVAIYSAFASLMYVLYLIILMRMTKRVAAERVESGR